MCGIVGRVGPGRCDLAPALDSIAHRGPDDRATWQGASPGGAVDLGFVRLSIIDLSPSGRQPMANEDGAVQVVFNGEIYNFMELRRELEGRGHRFRSHADSEVLVHGYEEYGDAVVDRLRGMFAFAIWDARQERLVCAVDRIGIKPFFWSDWGGAFHFGSEIKALLACGVPATMDAAGLEGYLQYLYVPPPRTMFREVRRLQPGHRLVWQRGSARLERYWVFPKPRPVADEHDLVAELRLHLKDAVQSHLVSDAPLGAFLSGGMDSSAIVALMAQASSKPVRTFCVTFDTPAFDERVYARAVAAHCGTEHAEIDVRPDVVSLLPTMVRQFDEPFGNATALLLYSLCEKARRHVKVALSGDGGDELFMGYPRYRGLQYATRLQKVPAAVRRALAGALGRLIRESVTGNHWPRRIREFVASSGESLPRMYENWVSYFAPDEVERLVLPGSRPSLPIRRRLEELFGECAGDPVDCVGYVDGRSFLPENILACTDRMSMAHGLEVRVPFCDHRLVEFLGSLPTATRLAGRRPKPLLRAAIAGMVPEIVLQRGKRGFVAPLAVWMNGALRETVRERLEPARVRREGVFDHNFVGRLIAEHASGRRDNSMQIWALLVFQEWARQYQGASSESQT